MKAIKQAQTREILDAYNKEDISYSRMNEMFNELADKFAIEFAEWLATDWTCDERWTIIVDKKELLELFKKEKGL